MTGVAGPAEQEGQPVGTVHVGLAVGDDVSSQTLQVPGDRLRIRQFATITVLEILRRRLLAANIHNLGTTRVERAAGGE